VRIDEPSHERVTVFAALVALIASLLFMASLALTAVAHADLYAHPRRLRLRAVSTWITAYRAHHSYLVSTLLSVKSCSRYCPTGTVRTVTRLRKC
jgi:hypothetical protein